MTSALFSPIRLAGLELSNRVVVAPMCQYSADDGVGNDWHMTHLGMLANSGAGMLVVEATAVERRGRITHGCLGLYSDACEAALGRVIGAVKRVAGYTRFGIQLAHAGRKASANRPWEDGGRPLAPGEDPWPVAGPSSMSYVDGWPIPETLDKKGMQKILTAFACAARRAARIGFEVVEIHAAHGY